MAQNTIRYRILADGRVEETVEGVLGQGCQQLTQGIESKLGAVQQRLPTADAFRVSQHIVTDRPRGCN